MAKYNKNNMSFGCGFENHFNQHYMRKSGGLSNSNESTYTMETFTCPDSGNEVNIGDCICDCELYQEWGDYPSKLCRFEYEEHLDQIEENKRQKLLEEEEDRQMFQRWAKEAQHRKIEESGLVELENKLNETPEEDYETRVKNHPDDRENKENKAIRFSKTESDNNV